MFSLIWRFFPGPAWLRVIVILAALVALVWAVVFYVYPWVSTVLPSTDGEITVQ